MANDKLPQAHVYYTINPLKWFALLWRNKGVSKSKVVEAIKISVMSLLCFPLTILDRILVAWKMRSITPDDEPVFIVGHWRSGTTFLHYLMAKDTFFGYLSLYQAFTPNIATIGGRFFKYLLRPLVPGKRPQDNIEVDIDLPAEEENAISTYSLASASHSFWFPQNEDFYNKYSLFEGISEKESKNWEKSYKWLMSKVAIAFPTQKPLIKNPHNSGRIPQLLKLYPNAKFIHIYRNPLKVLPSTYLMYDKVVRTQFLQDYSEEQLHDKIFYYYKTSMEKLFNDTKLIPKENIYELKFEDFEVNPLSELEAIYKQFGFTHFESVLPELTTYVNSKKSYQKNNHKSSPIDPKRILSECKFSFNKLGYPLRPVQKKEPLAKRVKASHI